MTNTCYFCDEDPCSREHVPPRCLFPEIKDLRDGKNQRKNLVSVPSCHAHNSAKSSDDEFLMWILAVIAQGNDLKDQHMLSKCMRAFERSPNRFIDIMSNLSPSLLGYSAEGLVKTATFEVDLDRFIHCMSRIAAGLYYHHYGKRWRGTYLVFTDAFFEMKNSRAAEINQTIFESNKRIVEAFCVLPYLGSNPSIFRYKYYSVNEGKHAVLMEFYEAINVSVALIDA
jgi:hypothetical protein